MCGWLAGWPRGVVALCTSWICGLWRAEGSDLAEVLLGSLKWGCRLLNLNVCLLPMKRGILLL